MLRRSTSPSARVLGAALGALAALAALTACSSSSGAPSVAPGSADATGWNKDSVAALRAVGHKIAAGLPGQCTKLGVPRRITYIGGLKRVGAPYPDAVGNCDALTEALEISMFPNNAVRDKFVENRVEKICAISREKNVGLPGLYWVVGDNYSVQPDSEGVARRVAHVLNATYRATGCNGTNPGWNPASVALLDQTASKLETNKQGCADIEVQDRDLISHTPPYNVIGTAGAEALCTLKSGATVVLTAYDTPADKTNQLLQAELDRQCGGAQTTRIVRVGDVAIFASTPAVASQVADAVGGSLSPLVCKKS
jgi:hypothetical protein